MKQGQNPDIAFVWRWLARLRAGTEFAVDQVVRPVVDVADRWPKFPEIRVVSNIDVGAAALLVEIWGQADWLSPSVASPAAAMLHRVSYQTGLTGTLFQYFDLYEPSGKFIRIHSTTAASGVFQPPIRDIYLPSGWTLYGQVTGTTPGDSITVTVEMSRAPQEVPLPRQI